MWPPAFWERLYEPLIRRAAGLGALSGVADPDACEKAFAFCDLLVIGAGPAGLMAALTAGRAGARVILADEDFLPGGRLNAERLEVGGGRGPTGRRRRWRSSRALPKVRLMTRTTVTGAYDGGSYGALERVAEHVGAAAGRAAAAVLLADRGAAGGALRRGAGAAGRLSRRTTGPG